MKTNRLEAFSDGVIAIIITIMVLELRPPHETSWPALLGLAPIFACYAVSFVFLAIYWNNHHHLLQTARTVNGAILWANTHLLFWLSLIPFTTAWMGEHAFAPVPTACYGIVLLMAAVAYELLLRILIAAHGEDSVLRRAVGGNRKGRLSLLLYAAAIPVAFFAPWIAVGLYLTVALIWLVPDRRIERRLRSPGET